MPSPAYQNGPRNPNHISQISKWSAVIAQDSPAATYTTLVVDELSARGQPANHKNIAAIVNQVAMAKAKNRLPTPRLQQIWATLFTGGTFLATSQDAP